VDPGGALAADWEITIPSFKIIIRKGDS